MLLEIEKQQREAGITILRLKGRLTLGREVQWLEDQVAELKKEGASKLVFDMTGVDYVDSAGLGVLTFCFAAFNSGGSRFCLAGVQERVQQILKVTRLDAILPRAETVEAACTQMAG